MIRKRLKWLSLAGLCLAIVGVGAITYYWSRPRLNLLLITLDTTRADRLGCYGYERALTPALDALAKQGVLFEKAYTAAPLTLPSHATMLTGLFPPEHGLRTNGRGKLGPQVSTLAELLAERGYQTGAFVASFVLNAKFGLDRGFQKYDDDLSGAAPTQHALYRQRSGDLVVDSAQAWWNQQKSHSVFCWIHFYDPHEPYQAHAEEFGDRFEDQPYDGELAFVDQQVGRMIDYLKTRGIAGNTLVVIVGDHGESLGEHNERTHGMTLYQSTLHVPLIIAPPGPESVGRRVPQAVSLVNLFPTLLDCLQVRARQPVSGRSLKDALGGAAIESDLCYSATDDPLFEQGWSPLRSLTDNQWKYIRSTKPELYDLLADPGELHNLASSNAEQLQSMEALLEEAEAQMVPRDGAEVQLSAAEKQALASLGYVGGTKPAATPKAGEPLPDVKDMLPFANALEDAKKLLDEKRLDDAVVEARLLVERAPDFLPGSIFLGEALVRQGKLDEAVAFLEKLAGKYPDRDDILFELGNARSAQGRLEDAAQLFQKAVDIDPEKPTIQYNLGMALTRLGRIDMALPHLEKALEADPGFVDAHVGMGIIRSQQRRIDAAISHFRKALEYDPGALEAHSNLAIALAGRGDAAGALTHFSRAVELAPDNAEAHFNLGIFLWTQRRNSEAIAELTETLRLNPNHPQARGRMEQILRTQSVPPR